jgi:hypothetical protein
VLPFDCSQEERKGRKETKDTRWMMDDGWWRCRDKERDTVLITDRTLQEQSKAKQRKGGRERQAGKQGHQWKSRIKDNLFLQFL